MRPLTALTMTAGQMATAKDLTFHDRWVWLNNESPSNVTVRTSIGSLNLPAYCSNLFDLCGEGGSPSLTCTAAVVLNYTSPPAVVITGDVYSDTEQFILPPRGLVPLTRQVSIGNSLLLTTSAQEVDPTYSGNATHPQIDTATPATGLGVEDQKASGIILLYPTQTDGTPRAIGLGYVDAGGVLHVGPVEDTTGSIRIQNGTGNTPSYYIIDQANNTYARLDIASEFLRFVGSYRGGAEQLLAQIRIQDAAVQLQGGFIRVSGITTAGSFGVPPIIAQVLRTVITDTSAHTILSFTIPANGVYRISGAIDDGNPTANNKPRITYNWLDTGGFADGGTAPSTSTAGFVNLDGAHTFPANFGAIGIMPIVAQMNAGAFSVVFQDTVATPNDTISIILERLA